ncbi:MAG: DUF4332 domain-containing protein [Thermoplasmatota archaeon]
MESPSAPIEVVAQHGNVRRIVFGGRSLPPPPPAARAPVAEVVPEPAPVDAPQESPSPLSEAVPAIQSIHDAVDRLGSHTTSRSTLANETPRGVRTASSVLYRTERGTVTETRMSDGSRERRLLYVTSVDEQGRQRTERFHESLVDPLIANVRLEGQGAPPAPVAVAEPGEGSYQVVQPVAEEPATAPVEGEPWEPAAEIPTRPMPTPVAAPMRRGPYHDFGGDNHEVIDIEGIGEEYARRLQGEGIFTTHRLCYESPSDLAARISVPEATVRGWQAQAQLIKVKGIGKQYAEALARAGITGIEQLKERGAEEIAAQVTSYLESLGSHVIGTTVTTKRVKGWQKAARTMRKSRQAVPPLGRPDFDLVRGHIPKIRT